jgi:hypothetical protein
MQNQLQNSIAAGAIISMAARNFPLAGGICSYSWKKTLSI